MRELDPKPGAKSALERIRERKLVQWGLAYAAGAWVVLEVATLVGEYFGWPVWIGRALIVLAVGGIPVALVLAWYHGERGRQRVSGPELLMLAALLVVAGAAVALVTRIGVTEASRSVSEQDARLTGAAEASAGIGDTRTSSLLPPDAPDARYSIAVLPFTSLSPDPEHDYFADAVTEEILNALAKLQGLRVTSRTSVMRYKQTEKRLPEIAAELGVSKVLEGSVQRQGDGIRIIAQLVDARTDAHLWSDAYQRQVSDLFQVQVEIAGEIADALQTELTPAERERIEAGQTGELTAYDLYLRARELVQTEFGDPEALRRAIQLLRRALEIDPDYARAHAGLAEALVVLQPFEGPRLGDTARACPPVGGDGAGAVRSPFRVLSSPVLGRSAGGCAAELPAGGGATAQPGGGGGEHGSHPLGPGPARRGDTLAHARDRAGPRGAALPREPGRDLGSPGRLRPGPPQLRRATAARPGRPLLLPELPRSLSPAGSPGIGGPGAATAGNDRAGHTCGPGSAGEARHGAWTVERGGGCLGGLQPNGLRRLGPTDPPRVRACPSRERRGGRLPGR